MMTMIDENMMRNAYGDEEMEKMTAPPYIEASTGHVLWPLVRAALCEVYDPEIPVNIYELGLIYKVDIDEKNNVFVEMTLTSPGCPVAGEMPGMVENAVNAVEKVSGVKVDIIWDPPWDPSKMAETAKLQLNMF